MEDQNRLPASLTPDPRPTSANSNTEPACAPIIYDDHWADPNADITFKSTQGICFWISSWHLAKHSTFFERLRRESPYPSMPIQVNLNNQLLDALLTKMILRPQSEDDVLGVYSPRLNDKLQLRAFFKLFEFDAALQKIESNILKNARHGFWPVLRGAGYYDDIPLATLIIRSMDLQHLNAPDFWNHVNCLRPDWRSPFLLAVICNGTPPADGGLKFKTDPERIAIDFELFLMYRKGQIKTIAGPNVKTEATGGAEKSEESEAHAGDNTVRGRVGKRSRVERQEDGKRGTMTDEWTV